MTEINYDKDYTDYLTGNIIERYSSTVKRVGTHISDLTMCLRKGWGKHHIPEEQWLERDPENDPMIMWAQGLQFEDLVGTMEPQQPLAYCFTCRAVSTMPAPVNNVEVANCTVCNGRWLIGTPDYKVPDGAGNMIIHESKQTRKSQRQGPGGAPWWIEQLESYILFDHLRNGQAPGWGRLVVNWLMGDYGERKKGKRPRPPRSAIEAFNVTFTGDELAAWHDELARRKAIVEGDEMPPLTGMGEGGERSPAYEWECAGCNVGKAAGCEMFKWDDADDEIGGKEDAMQVGSVIHIPKMERPHGLQ